MLVAMKARAHRQAGEDRRGDAVICRDRSATLAHHVGRGGRVGELDRLDIADDMVGRAIAPGPARSIFEHRERFSGKKLGDRLALSVRLAADEGGVGAAAAQNGPGEMRRDDPAREGDVGEIASVGVDSRIERQGRAGQPEALSRAGE